MKSQKVVCAIALAVFSLVLIAFASSLNKPASQAQKPAQSDLADAGTRGTVEGLIRDIACPIQNRRASATEFNLDCAVECAKSGSPLIILTKSGLIYTPISDTMPDKSQHDRLMPFVGKYVKATGVLYEREGAHAIAIKEITEMKDVHLITDAK